MSDTFDKTAFNQLMSIGLQTVRARIIEQKRAQAKRILVQDVLDGDMELDAIQSKFHKTMREDITNDEVLAYLRKVHGDVDNRYDIS